LVKRDGRLAGPLAPLEALRWIDLAQWDLWVDERGAWMDDRGAVRGDLRIRLNTRE